MQQALGLIALRVVLGTIFVAHASDKLGWYSISAIMSQEDLTLYTQQVLGNYRHLLSEIFVDLNQEQLKYLASTSALLELLCGWMLILGVFTRPAALYLSIMMTVAVFYHFPFGFFRQ